MDEAEEEHNLSTWYDILKDNLLDLTSKVAPVYDEQYDTAFFATHSYLEFENHVLAQEINSLIDRGLALDIGCATGRTALALRSKFRRVIGYDISPSMIERARAKLAGSSTETLSFEQLDIEQGIPQPDASVSLIVMNMGTASDLLNIERILIEAQRVLVPNGKLFLSFYNADALMYRWEFLPWRISLAAEINIKKHCLDVHFDNEVFSIYARPYTVDEIKKLIPHGIELTKILTYPTISSILPDELFEDATIKESVAEIDRKLAESTAGAYIVAVGSRSSNSPTV
jgi:ubiquinone/menaquinone biosynthesis C-methylase UbiE